MERRQKTFLALTFFLVVSIPLSKVYIEPVYTELPVAEDVQAQIHGLKGASWKTSLTERNLLVEANDYSPPGANPKHDPISPPSST